MTTRKQNQQEDHEEVLQDHNHPVGSLCHPIANEADHLRSENHQRKDRQRRNLVLLRIVNVVLPLAVVHEVEVDLENDDPRHVAHHDVNVPEARTANAPEVVIENPHEARDQEVGVATVDDRGAVVMDGRDLVAVTGRMAPADVEV